MGGRWCEAPRFVQSTAYHPGGRKATRAADSDSLSSWVAPSARSGYCGRRNYIHSTLQITQSCPVPSLKPGAVQSTYFPAFSDTRLISAFPFHSTSFSSQFSSNINPERPSGSPQTHKKSVDKIKDTENLPFLSAAQRL